MILAEEEDVRKKRKLSGAGSKSVTLHKSGSGIQDGTKSDPDPQH